MAGNALLNIFVAPDALLNSDALRNLYAIAMFFYKVVS
jgi:hypothetical protein